MARTKPFNEFCGAQLLLQSCRGNLLTTHRHSGSKASPWPSITQQPKYELLPDLSDDQTVFRHEHHT